MDFNGLYEKASLISSMFLLLPCGQSSPHFLQQQLCSVHFQNRSLIRFVRGATIPNLDWYHLCTIGIDIMAPYQVKHITFS
jgi:hypothetical protein